jgi:choline dehydrogenase-like flavoprotein
MPLDLPRLSPDPGQRVRTQDTEFSRDVLGRYICNTFEEADCSTRPEEQPGIRGERLDAKKFDIIVLGGGTFGAAFAEHIWYRDRAKQHRILVLEAGPFVLPEHNQNLPMVGLGVPDPSSVAEYNAMNSEERANWRKDVWGLPWHSSVKFPGLAYCVGGRSIYWGGWSPQLLPAEMPLAGVPLPWPKPVVDQLTALTGDDGYFRQASIQIGVNVTNDFIFEKLHDALKNQLFAGYAGARHVVPLTELELHLDHDPAISATEKDRLKLEAPLAVQGRAPRAGFFPFNKFSAVPVLMKAARAAVQEAANDNVRRRLMIVPNCHVTRLNTESTGSGLRVTGLQTNLGSISLAEGGSIVIALATVESTRLALNSFQGVPHYSLIGRNLMAHLRSNVDIRIPRAAIATLDPALKELQTSALFVKGRKEIAGRFRHFHLQITASGLGKMGGNSEAEMWQKVPDIDGFEPFKNVTDSHVVITIRGIGEMEPFDPDLPDTQSSRVKPDPDPDEFGVPRALVELQPTPNDQLLWKAMDETSDDIAKIFSGGMAYEVFTPQGVRLVNPSDDLSQILLYSPRGHADEAKRGRRDGLGTTHHETGTLWMGTDPARSVTNPDARFHGVENAYVVGPAIFPGVGSPNPMLTGIALGRRLGDLLGNPQPFVAEAGFTTLFNGFDTSNWAMTTIRKQPGRDDPGSFRIRNAALESVAGNDLGIYWCKTPMPANFVLRLEWLRWTHDSNSGVYLRFPDPESKGYNNGAYVADQFGFEVQIDELGKPDGKGIHKTGAIYRADQREDNEVLTQKPALPAGQWNSYEIRVEGSKFTVKMNGDVVCVFDNPYPGRGLPSTAAVPTFIGLQAYPNPAWSVAYRRIRFQAI